RQLRRPEGRAERSPHEEREGRFPRERRVPPPGREAEDDDAPLLDPERLSLGRGEERVRPGEGPEPGLRHEREGAEGARERRLEAVLEVRRRRRPALEAARRRGEDALLGEEAQRRAGHALVEEEDQPAALGDEARDALARLRLELARRGEDEDARLREARSELGL